MMNHRRSAAAALIALMTVAMAMPVATAAPTGEQAPPAVESSAARDGHWTSPTDIANAEESTIEVFTRRGCARCAAAKAFLRDLSRERPALRILEHRVDEDPKALEMLQERARAAGITTPGVPLFVVRGVVVVGFENAETSGAHLRALLEGKEIVPQAGETCRVEVSETCPGMEPVDSIQTTLFGKISVSSLGLPLFTLAIGLLDGFNPCAMWVLVFLLSMLASLHDRRRMVLIAGTFVFTSGAVYYAFMAAWLNVFLLIGMSRAIEIVLGLVALAMGALNVKDYVAFKKGVSLSIPESKKPQIYARVRSIIRENKTISSLVLVVSLAVLVNFIELLCTAGFPAVYTAILTKQGLPRWGYYAYLGLYNVAYIADDTLMVTVAVITLSRRKLTERAGRWLKLVSGVVMLGLAVMLLIWPDKLR